MSPEQQMPLALRRVGQAPVTTGWATQLDDIAARLMAVQRQWNDPERELRLAAALAAGRAAWNAVQAALAEGDLALPPEVRHNLLILSVYADSKICACESATHADALGSLIAMTRTLAGSLRQWREAA